MRGLLFFSSCSSIATLLLSKKEMSLLPTAKTGVEISLSVEQFYHITRGKRLFSGTQDPLFLPERAMNVVSCTYVRTGMMKQRVIMVMVKVNSVHNSLRKKLVCLHIYPDISPQDCFRL